MRALVVSLSASLLFALVARGEPPTGYARLERGAFNRLAQEMWLPLFWRSDANQNKAVDPDEVVWLWGLRRDAQLADYVADAAYTPAFADVYEAMVARAGEPRPDPMTVEDPEARRRALVLQELGQGRPTLVEWDFTSMSDEDKAVVEHVLKAAEVIEHIFERQSGVVGWEAKIPADDPASRTLFFRNHGPFCLQPATEQNPDCNALPDKPKRVVGIYPASLQEREGFCDALGKEANAAELTRPFVVVREDNGALAALPYTTAYRRGMKKVSDELKAAADALADPNEAAFKAYLLAASQAFLDNNWEPADEAWSKMNATNSKWYLRIGPDETYWEPCSLKAGFHVSFARINQDSLEWQRKLDPLKNDMEKALAKLAGKPYKAREVSFHLPDFIDIVVNAGDSRAHAGATIGQSLPNWGPVANEGRGRTVAMTNLYTDEDSRASLVEQASSLFCPATMKKVDADPKLMTTSTVLHEAAHNLGPAHEYQVDGKTDDQIFGGPMAAMLEELKSQTAALYFTDWLVKKKLLDKKTAERTHVRDLTWAFGHIAQGMYTAEGKPKAYSQLAAIQLGALMKGGAVKWNKKKTAANGKDKGCFEVNAKRFEKAVTKLAKDVLHIKGAGDKAKAEAMKKAYVDDKKHKEIHAVIAERWLRAPKATFVYSVRW